jgi:hypothetical protein
VRESLSFARLCPGHVLTMTTHVLAAGSGSSLGHVLGLVIAAVIGLGALFQAIRPDVLVQMNNRMSQWQFRNRPTLAPSRAALTYARVIGIVVFAMATFAFVMEVR